VRARKYTLKKKDKTIKRTILKLRDGKRIKKKRDMGLKGTEK
jgi:hypothetical protein